MDSKSVRTSSDNTYQVISGKKTKVFYVVSNIDKALAFEWLAVELPERNIIPTFVLLNQPGSNLEQHLREKEIHCYQLGINTKVGMLSALFRLFLLLRRYRPASIHCHLFHANIIGLLAGWLARIPQRIYTRHHSTFHHQYYPRAVILDRLVNYLSTDIVAISKNVEQVLQEKEKVSSTKISLIHHGFRVTEFSNVSPERISAVRLKYQIPPLAYPVVGIVARYFHLKGIQYTIPPFSQLLHQYPQAHLLLANAKGNFKDQLVEQLRKLPEGSYTEIEFEEDMVALYHCMDLHVHVPINKSIEAFGQTYVEALAAGVPSVFTLSGVAREFIRDRYNAMVVTYEDEQAIYQAMVELLKNEQLRQQITAQGYQDVQQHFALKGMVNQLANLYLDDMKVSQQFKPMDNVVC